MLFVPVEEDVREFCFPRGTFWGVPSVWNHFLCASGALSMELTLQTYGTLSACNHFLMVEFSGPVLLVGTRAAWLGS